MIARQMITGYAAQLNQRSIELVHWLDNRHRTMLMYWVMLASFACGVRLSASSYLAMPTDTQIATALPYALVVGTPVASIMLAFHWFGREEDLVQPETRLARFGKWRTISPATAKSMPLYGATGLMASLLAGMLINIPVRMLEFLAAMPVIGGATPSWYNSLYALMLIDEVVLTSFYAIAFVAALRHVPQFPRLLAAIWALDISMQIMISKLMVQQQDLPVNVAHALQQLLDGNLKKVLISMAIWTPYLLLSRRVNLTYRHRVPD